MFRFWRREKDFLAGLNLRLNKIAVDQVVLIPNTYAMRGPTRMAQAGVDVGITFGDYHGNLGSRQFIRLLPQPKATQVQ